MGVVRATRTLERQLQRRGFVRVAGVDEVGRGCLAGPVVAAAVVLDPCRHVPGLRDSKMLSAAQRERCYALITRRALAWAIGEAPPQEIDELNIYWASLVAMRRAVLALNPLPDLCWWMRSASPIS
jgi:ribonuclease HII